MVIDVFDFAVDLCIDVPKDILYYEQPPGWPCNHPLLLWSQPWAEYDVSDNISDPSHVSELINVFRAILGIRCVIGEGCDL